MKKFVMLAVGACLCLANNGSCLGGGVNSPGGPVATICTRAAQAAATAAGVLQVLIANGIEVARAEKLAAAVSIGSISIEAACAAAQGAGTPPSSPGPSPAPAPVGDVPAQPVTS